MEDSQQRVQEAPSAHLPHSLQPNSQTWHLGPAAPQLPQQLRFTVQGHRHRHHRHRRAAPTQPPQPRCRPAPRSHPRRTALPCRSTNPSIFNPVAEPQIGGGHDRQAARTYTQLRGTSSPAPSRKAASRRLPRLGIPRPVTFRGDRAQASHPALPFRPRWRPQGRGAPSSPQTRGPARPRPRRRAEAARPPGSRGARRGGGRARRRGGGAGRRLPELRELVPPRCLLPPAEQRRAAAARSGGCAEGGAGEWLAPRSGPPHPRPNFSPRHFGKVPELAAGSPGPRLGAADAGAGGCAESGGQTGVGSGLGAAAPGAQPGAVGAGWGRSRCCSGYVPPPTGSGSFSVGMRKKLVCERRQLSALEMQFARSSRCASEKGALMRCLCRELPRRGTGAAGRSPVPVGASRRPRAPPLENRASGGTTADRAGRGGPGPSAVGAARPQCASSRGQSGTRRSPVCVRGWSG